MNEITVYLTISGALLALALLFWRRNAFEIAADSRWSSPSAASELELPSRELLARIFSASDDSFASAQTAGIRRIFLQDRKVLAMSWLAQVQRVASTLRSRHRLSARQDRSLNVLAELRLEISFLNVLLLCEVLALSIQLLGVMRVKFLTGLLARASEHLSVGMAPQTSESFA